MGQPVWHRWEGAGSAGQGAGARLGGAIAATPGLPAMRLAALAGLTSGASSPRAARVGGVTPMFRRTAAPCSWGGSWGPTVLWGGGGGSALILRTSKSKPACF